jgi:hypothetical protein
MASPSNDSDILKDGGEIREVRTSGVVECVIIG